MWTRGCYLRDGQLLSSDLCKDLILSIIVKELLQNTSIIVKELLHNTTIIVKELLHDTTILVKELLQSLLEFPLLLVLLVL